MIEYIILLLDQLITELSKEIAIFVIVISELVALQLKYPEIAVFLDDEIADLESRRSRLEALRDDVILLKKKHNPSGDAARIVFLDENNEEIKEKKMFLKVNQKLPLSIAIKDKFGNDAKVDGAPVWALSDPSLGALAVAADGMSAELTPAGALGSFKVQVKADADLDATGVKEILGELEIDLLAGDAEVVAISAGQPV